MENLTFQVWTLPILVNAVNRTSIFVLVCIISGVLWFTGCATIDRTKPAVQPLEPGTFAVPGDQAWTSTGIVLGLNHKLLIEEVKNPRPILVKGEPKQAVSARGTYLFDLESGPYPLEPDRVHDDMRYPGYCLIARIGENGVPFFVGELFQGLAPQAGMLWLGITVAIFIALPPLMSEAFGSIDLTRVLGIFRLVFETNLEREQLKWRLPRLLQFLPRASSTRSASMFICGRRPPVTATSAWLRIASPISASSMFAITISNRRYLPSRR